MQRAVRRKQARTSPREKERAAVVSKLSDVRDRDAYCIKLSTLDGKLWEFDTLREMAQFLEHYPSVPKLSKNVGARIAPSMREELVELKLTTGVSYADVVRMGIGEALRRAKG